jgi:16S rRNA (cytosine1402-N4)-methyltransferase
LDQTDRGFAYARDAPLDMRMDGRASDLPTAADILNTYSQQELIRVLRQHGQERFAPAIARAIVRRRATAPLRRSSELVDLIRAAVPAPARRTGGNPAKRTFQALRIEVNDELGALQRVLPQAIDRLTVGGRIVVLSYHSGEDAVVKTALRDASVSSSPPGFPVELPQHAPQLRLVVRGAEKASEAEALANTRASSVRLRAAERVRPAGQRAASGALRKPRESGGQRLDPGGRGARGELRCRVGHRRIGTSPAEKLRAGRATTEPAGCTMTGSELDRRAS